MFLVEATITIFLLLISYYKFSCLYWKRLKVPYIIPKIPWGSYPNPFLRKENFGDVLTQMYHQMKKRGHKYFGIYLFSKPCLVAADSKYVKIFLATASHAFNYRNLYYNEKDDPVSAHLLAINGDKWRNMRNKLTPMFTTNKIKMIFKLFIHCGEFLEKTLECHSQNGDPLNVRDMFLKFSSDIIINVAFGLEADLLRKKEFKEHARKATTFSISRCLTLYLGCAFPNLCRMLGLRQIAKSSGDFFIEVVGDTVAYRERNNYVRNDFLQLLINLKNQKINHGEEFTIEEITAQCFLFYMAGHETASSTMTLALYEIATNPHIYEKLLSEIHSVLGKYGEITYDAMKEMTYLEQVIYETLRLHSPIYYISRTSTKDFYLEDDDLMIKKGTTVYIPIRGFHSDPEIYLEPEIFNPERFHPSRKQNIDQYAFLAFGEGPRICFGFRFALMEIKTALVMILQKYRFSVNSKTQTPLRPNPSTFLFDVQGGIWLNCEKITQ